MVEVTTLLFTVLLGSAVGLTHVYIWRYRSEGRDEKLFFTFVNIHVGLLIFVNSGLLQDLTASPFVRGLVGLATVSLLLPMGFYMYVAYYA